MHIYKQIKDLPIGEKIRLDIRLTQEEENDIKNRNHIITLIDEGYKILKSDINYSDKLNCMDLLFESLSKEIKNYNGLGKENFEKKLRDLYSRDNCLRGY